MSEVTSKTFIRRVSYLGLISPGFTINPRARCYTMKCERTGSAGSMHEEQICESTYGRRNEGNYKHTPREHGGK